MVKLIIFIILCIGAGYFDLKKMIIPNWITFPGILLGISFAIITKEISLQASLLGGLMGLVFLGLVAWIGHYFLKKEALGGGDIKLAIMIGAFLGIEPLVMIIFLSSLIALISTLILYKIKKKEIHGPIPYGFYIAIVSVVYQIKIFLQLDKLNF